jgi:hypothetical protein
LFRVQPRGLSDDSSAAGSSGASAAAAGNSRSGRDAPVHRRLRGRRGRRRAPGDEGDG